MNKTVNSIQYSVFRGKTEQLKQFSENRKQKTIHYSLFTIHCLLFTAYCLLFTAGCSHTPPSLSDAHKQAIELNQRAESVFKKGDYKRALDIYKDALRINRSIENFDGIAINLINMAIVYHKLGDTATAHQCIDELLGSSPPLHAGAGFTVHSSLLSEAAFIKALLYMDDGDYSQASEWSEKALFFCSTQCPAEGRIYNLKGRLAFLKGDFPSALSYADRGLELNKKYEDSEEMANSMRLTAEAKAGMGKYEDAKRLFEEALAVDRGIGTNRKIAMDLMGLGGVFCRQGMLKDAVQYYKRALSVSENSGDKHGVTDAMTAMERCLQGSERP